MTVRERIEMIPKVRMGNPVIRGARIPAEFILRKISEWANEADLWEACPNLTQEDIQAAIRYAADTLAHEEAGIRHSMLIGNNGTTSPVHKEIPQRS